ncbi:MAG: HAD-IIIA family hydrolase [Candidatus Omnitrophica bacterium]|nr:HAD-IIIA family hydrolase [Candidatus Omnitrophota bacterium]
MKTKKAKKIKIVIVDVDGVLTDGTIGYGNYNDDYRRFHVQDGFGFVLLAKGGIKSAIITSKTSKAVQRRAKELKINMVCQNTEKKLIAFNKILKKYKLKAEQACYIGDDLLDLAVLNTAGFSVTVPQACDDIQHSVDFVTTKDAGYGAVREAIEFILKAQNKWDDLVKKYS